MNTLNRDNRDDVDLRKQTRGVVTAPNRGPDRQVNPQEPLNLAQLNIEQLWQRVLELVRQRVPEPSYNTWLVSTQLVGLEWLDAGSKGNRKRPAAGAVPGMVGPPPLLGQDGVQATIEVASRFAAEWLDKHFRAMLSRALGEVLCRPTSVQFAACAQRTNAGGTRALAALQGLPMAAGSEGRAAPTNVGRSSNGWGGATNRLNDKASGSGLRPSLPGQPPRLYNTNPGQGTPGGNFAGRPATSLGRLGPAQSGDSAASYTTVVESAQHLEVRLDASQLEATHLFETFVIGPANQLAYAACMAAADRPGRVYNPLFLYGHAGLGKTHLLHALAHDTLRRTPGATVLYLTANRLAELLNHTNRESLLPELRTVLRGVDLLLLDDLQHLPGRVQLQEELLKAVDELHRAGKQIVATGDRPPRALMLMGPSLRSRFEGGLIAEILPPSLQMRAALLRKKAEASSVPVPADVIDYLAQWEESNMRQLQGALTRIVALAQLTGRPLDTVVAAEALRDFGPHLRRRSAPSLDEIVDAVCSYFNVEVLDLKTGTRSREVLLPRQVAMYMMRVESEVPYDRIAQFFGKRDHTTAMHSVNKIEVLVDNNRQIREEVLLIRQMLYGAQRQSEVR